MAAVTSSQDVWCASLKNGFRVTVQHLKSGSHVVVIQFGEGNELSLFHTTKDHLTQIIDGLQRAKQELFPSNASELIEERSRHADSLE